MPLQEASDSEDYKMLTNSVALVCERTILTESSSELI
jgi:hypothetical protein